MITGNTNEYFKYWRILGSGNYNYTFGGNPNVIFSTVFMASSARVINNICNNQSFYSRINYQKVFVNGRKLEKA